MRPRSSANPKLKTFTDTFFSSRHMVEVGLCIMQFEPHADDPFYAKPIAEALDLQPVQVLRDMKRFSDLGMIIKSEVELPKIITNAKLMERNDHEYWEIVQVIGSITHFVPPELHHIATDRGVQP